MHPRNRYSAQKPDFAALAKSHPPLHEHLVWKTDDYATLDFKSPSAQKELMRALLKQDFHLDVDMPLDKLIPTVPQKLNYIHWIEDLLSGRNAGNIPKGEGTRGIDIGTGPVCIYPLLATCLNNWSFTATEIDPVSLDYAARNVSSNSLEGRIEVKGVDPDTVLVGVVKEEEKFDFCMCNPPFYSVHEDHHGDQRPPPPHSSSSGQAHEVAVPGGEVGFVSRMVEDSLLMPSRVRWFTSMVGKKGSLKDLKALLRKRQVPTITTTELVQGVTKRWAIAWSFTEQVPYNPSHPPSCIVPLAGSSGRRRVQVTQWLEGVLQQLEISCTRAGSQAGYICTTERATWTNQRRKRRLLQRMTSPDAGAKRRCGGSDSASGSVLGDDLDTLATASKPSPKADSLERNASSDLAARLSALAPPCRVSFSCDVQHSVANSSSQAELELKLVYIDGSGPQELQQIAQYLKNKWSTVDLCNGSDDSCV